MPRNTDGNRNSYEDIVRKTVVEPDSSARPTEPQEQAAREGFRALDVDERALQEQVERALMTSGVDISGVTVEVSRERVTLRGRVVEARSLQVLEDAAARVAGVDTIHNLVVVGSP